MISDHTIPVSVVDVDALLGGTPVVLLAAQQNRGVFMAKTNEGVLVAFERLRVVQVMSGFDRLAIDLTRKLGQMTVHLWMLTRIDDESDPDWWTSEHMITLGLSAHGEADPAQLKALVERLADH